MDTFVALFMLFAVTTYHVTGQYWCHNGTHWVTVAASCQKNDSQELLERIQRSERQQSHLQRSFESLEAKYKQLYNLVYSQDETTNITKNCPSGFKQWKNYCYSTITNEKVDRGTALTRCKRLGAERLTIETRKKFYSILPHILYGDEEVLKHGLHTGGHRDHGNKTGLWLYNNKNPVPFVLDLPWCKNIVRVHVYGSTVVLKGDKLCLDVANESTDSPRGYVCQIQIEF